MLLYILHHGVDRISRVPVLIHLELLRMTAEKAVGVRACIDVHMDGVRARE